MIFRIFDQFPLYETQDKPNNSKEGSQATLHEQLFPKPIDKGFYYKFNGSNEIKLVKYFLEDNGFLP